jgi:predicted phosphoadenosine phosphosulfate sulfurtransferase
MLKQVYSEKTVLEATQERISYLFDEFEQIIVSVSGGKDSTVLAHLALLEAHKRNRKVGVFFLDEEAVYESTIDQIKYLMSLYPENTTRLWLQVEFNLTNSTSLTAGQLRAWEPGKGELWIHQKKRFAIQHKPWDEAHEKQNGKNGLGFYEVLENWENSHHNTAFLVGIRAVESMNRWRAVSKSYGYKNIRWATKKPNNNYTFYPLYDWGFNDIWKYLAVNKIRYSKIYDYMYRKGMKLPDMRVSSLIHEKSYKSLVELPEFEPKTYNRLLKRVQGISIGNLYGHDKKMLRVQKLPKNFQSWQSYRDFLLKTYPDVERKGIFEKRFAKHFSCEYVAKQQCRQLVLNDYENNLTVDNKMEDPLEVENKRVREEKLKKWMELL